MEIVKGIFLNNKVKKYLLPGLVNGYGKVFKQKFNTQICKLAVGLYDKILDGTNILGNKKGLFILVDSTVLPKEFERFKSWITYKSFYITDYQYEENKHMFVLEIPRELLLSYEKFIKGKYSEMYTPKEVEEYFSDKESDEYKVIVRNLNKKKEFINEVKKRFDVEVRESDFAHAESDFPPSVDIKNEVFNYE